MKKFIVTALEWLCSRFDDIPRWSRQDGWYRHGCWGCYPLGLANKSLALDDRWQTGVWK